MPKIETWLTKHLVTVMISMICAGMVAFATTTFGFTQTTINTEATLKQSIALLDERVATYQDSSNKQFQSLAADTKEIKKLLQEYVVKVAVLESKQDTPQ